MQFLILAWRVSSHIESYKNLVGQIYLAYKIHILLIRFGQMSINYRDIIKFGLTKILKM